MVEPDDYYQRLFRASLGQLVELQVLRRGREAEQSIQKSAPDALVMEMLLPDQSGYQLLQKIRKEPERQSLPIIIFSRVGSLEDVEASFAYGVAGYFVKGQDSVHDVKKLILSLVQ